MESLMTVKIVTNEKDIELIKENVLGIIEYGKTSNKDVLSISDTIPYQFIELKNSRQSYYEIWCTSETINYTKRKNCTMSISNSYSFLSVTIKESGRYQYDAQMAYKELFDSLNMDSYSIVRFWNYIPGINNMGNIEEKYKEFCRGREHTFSEYSSKLMEIYPAATGIGCEGERLCVSLLAVDKKMTVRSIENPRQIPAYQYPNRYGISTPKFSRATYIKNEMEDHILVSGTASIIGADTVYIDSVEMQTNTAIENIFELISQENLKRYKIEGISLNQSLKLIKVYIRNWEDYSIVKEICEKRFGKVEALYLQNDICRKDLLVEIEAVVSNTRTK